MNFAGSIAAIAFGIIWTAIAYGMTSGFPDEMGVVRIFPLFGLIFIIVGIVQAIYHYKNFTGKNRMSILDITDSREEPDPLNQRFGSDYRSEELYDRPDEPAREEAADKYCPYCGQPMDAQFQFCPKCGKEYRL